MQVSAHINVFHLQLQYPQEYPPSDSPTKHHEDRECDVFKLFIGPFQGQRISFKWQFSFIKKYIIKFFFIHIMCSCFSECIVYMPNFRDIVVIDAKI